MWAAWLVLKLVLCGELVEFMAVELWSVIRYDCVGNPVSGKVGLTVVDHGFAGGLS